MLIACSGAMACIAAMISSRRKRPAFGDDRGGTDRFGDRLDAAEAAAGRARDMAPPLVEPLGVRRLEPHPQLDAVVELDDVERADLVGGLHDAFAEAEADREIPQVLRRRHHHGVGAAIVGEGDRGLLRDRRGALADAAVAPDPTIGRCEPVRASRYSAASTAGAMRRDWRACSS